MKINPNFAMKYFGYWPPYLASGIKVIDFDLDEGYVVSQLKQAPWNSNAYGTLYGGSLFSMCDPFYVFILAHKLGKAYYVWDIESNIRFKKATKSKVQARFQVTDQEIQEIIEKAESGEKVLPEFTADIVDLDGNTIAEVYKKLYVKKKRPKN